MDDVTTNPEMDADEKPEPEPEFYRPLAEAREQAYSTAELEHRESLTRAIVRDLRAIRDTDGNLDEVSRRIGNIGTALRLLARPGG